MTFPVVEQVRSVGGKANPWNVPLPNLYVSGDLLVGFLATRDDAGVATVPAGWNVLLNDVNQNGPGAVVIWQVATTDYATQSSVSISFDDRRDFTATVYRISGHGSSVEISSIATGDSTTPNPSSLSPSWGSKDTLWIAACSGNDSEDFIGSPASYTDPYDQIKSQATSRTCQRENATATEDPGTFLFDNGRDWLAVTLGIEPAGGAGPTTTPLTITASATASTGQVEALSLSQNIGTTVTTVNSTSRAAQFFRVSVATIAPSITTRRLIGRSMPTTVSVDVEPSKKISRSMFSTVSTVSVVDDRFVLPLTISTSTTLTAEVLASKIVFAPKQRKGKRLVKGLVRFGSLGLRN